MTLFMSLKIESTSLSSDLELTCQLLADIHFQEEGVEVSVSDLKSKVSAFLERMIADALESLPAQYSDRAVKQALFGNGENGGGAL